MSQNNEIAKALAEAIVQAANYVKRDANEYSKSAIKNTKIYGNQIRQNSIPGFMLQDGSVPFLKIRELSAEVARIALAEIAVADIEFAQIKNVVIGNAHIGTAGIDYAHIKDLDAESAYFGSQIFELGLGDSLYMGRLRVNAANIAHLEVGELILEDANGDLYKIGIDEFGDVVTSLYEVGYQNIATTTKNLMSQYTVYRGATAPESPYVDQLWVKTDTDIIYRCTALLPTVVWEPVKANELHTSYINAVETGLEILSTGKIDVKSGGAININNGGDINVDSMGDINIANGGKINVASGGDIDVAAGGKINITTDNDLVLGGQNITAFADGRIDAKASTIDLSANNSIKLAVSGGTNLLRGTSRTETLIATEGGTEVTSAVDSITLLPSTTYTISGFWRSQSNCKGMELLVYYAASPMTDYHNWLQPYSVSTRRFVYTFTTSTGGNYQVRIDNNGSTGGVSGLWYKEIKLEKGTMATDWSPSPSDPASGVKTSYISIDNDSIDIVSGGNMNLETGTNLYVKSGADIDIASGGDIDVQSGGNLNIKSGGDIEIESGADINVASSGKINVASGGDIEVASGADINVQSGGKINVASGGDIEIASGGDVNIASGGSMNIASGGDLTISGGTVDIETNTFGIKNTSGQSLLAISSASGGDPGGQLIIGSDNMPMRIGGNYVLPLENGGTGNTGSNRVHFISAPPGSSLGGNGDLAVMAGASSGGYTAISPTWESTNTGLKTLRGVYRNWNSAPVSGYIRAGNANTASVSYYYGASWYFTAPAGMSTSTALTLNFVSVKYLSSTWYGWNVSVPITIALYKYTSGDNGTFLGKSTFVPTVNATSMSVSVPVASGALTGGIIVQIFDESESANKSVCLINSLSAPAVTGGAQFQLYVKHDGTWYIPYL